MMALWSAIVGRIQAAWAILAGLAMLFILDLIRRDARRAAEIDAWKVAHEAEKQRAEVDRSGDPDGARERLRERARRG